jgi:hypothetical protein
LVASYAVAAALAAFTLQPLLRFADPAALAGSTLLMFAGFSQCLSAADESPKSWLRHTGFWIGAAMLLAGAGLIISSLSRAQVDASANDTRCSIIQREMLLPVPKRPDLPDLFTALGCRPQGSDGFIQFPRSASPFSTK